MEEKVVTDNYLLVLLLLLDNYPQPSVVGANWGMLHPRRELPLQ